MTKPRALLTVLFAALVAFPGFADPPPRNAPASKLPPEHFFPVILEEVPATAATENLRSDVPVPQRTGAGLAPAPQAPTSLWDRIRAGFAMPEIESALVARHEAWFLNHPDYTQRMIERSRLYLYYIVEEVEKRGMPMEVALLPMIESGFNPEAYSRAHAAGIWQFIPSTGRRYGLQQDWWYDARRDVLAATRAALDYLQHLHAQFYDWRLALAAYNWGENGVARAIARNHAGRKPADYHSLRMPRETRNYLPKLQAVKNIVANPEGVGFALEDIPDQPYFTTVTTSEHIDMEVAARLAEMSEDDFRSLNPGHTRPVITSDGSRTLLLPIEKAGAFNANLKDYDQPLLSWQTYTVKKHEMLEQVAAQFNISTARLKEINGINRHLSVPAGRTLLVPMNEEMESSNLTDTWDNPEFLAPEDYYMNQMVYRVKSGDSLYSIARVNRVTVAALKEWNRLRSNRIRPGQHLNIYSNPRPTPR
ncbi:MAG: transglycosylase SLT domain-containing protein [Betaproteobacteria bacterium]